ncbi:MAG: NFACT RNA binding domain-containing protein [Eubacteriales bacterium]|nr:NFACT RNA binding domain-containing protein [Eubacteriales bacterium]
MAFDGIITYAMVKELQDKIHLGKIEKIYQPENDELVFHIHTKGGNHKLFASVASSHPRIHFIEKQPANPAVPLSFCMLLRKHLQGSRIISIEQKDSERIIEICFETLNELGFTVSKKLIFEIMGKHSNIVLIDMTTGKIIDSIKRISIDVNRIRQILPGKLYEYPPAQDKIPFKTITKKQLDDMENNPKLLLNKVGGISPTFAEEMACKEDKWLFLSSIINLIENRQITPFVYLDEQETPQEFHIIPLSEYKSACKEKSFDDLSQCLDFFFDHKSSSNRVKQKSRDLIKTVDSALEKIYLKKQRLCEDILKAENSEELRLFGELLTANIHMVKPGQSTVEVINYYDGTPVIIPIDTRYSAAKNAQVYFKKYGKSKTAIREKQIQLEDTNTDINYLESVLSYLENTDNIDEIDALRSELIETGYVRKRKTNYKEKRYKPSPLKFETSEGFQVLVGRNNKENDILTLKTAGNKDYWFHTKDIPGSHTILLTEGRKITETAIFEAAAIAAYHSKGRSSENVPVDYVLCKYVKKPAGAKPGMVIFHNNKTVWVNPKEGKNSTAPQ